MDRFHVSSACRRSLLAAAAITLGALSAQPLAAQLRPAGTSALDYPPRQTFTFNPIGIAAGVYSAEYELAVATQQTVALSASYADINNDDFTSLDLRWRLYADRALDGFAVGLSLGSSRTRDADRPEVPGQFSLTIGTQIDYVWLLGAEENFALGVGGGFKRFVSATGRDENAANFWPTIRLAVGAAF